MTSNKNKILQLHMKLTEREELVAGKIFKYPFFFCVYLSKNMEGEKKIKKKSVHKICLLTGRYFFFV